MKKIYCVFALAILAAPVFASPHSSGNPFYNAVVGGLGMGFCYLVFLAWSWIQQKIQSMWYANKYKNQTITNNIDEIIANVKEKSDSRPEYFVGVVVCTQFKDYALLREKTLYYVQTKLNPCKVRFVYFDASLKAILS